MSDVKIVLDPAVAAAKRLIAKELPSDINDDVVTIAIVVLRLAGYQIEDRTGEGVPNTEAKPG